MSTMIVPAKPDSILKELAKVWTSLGKEEKDQGKPTVLRACAMTLIIATDDKDEESFAASQTLVALMKEHPSRAIVLRKSEQTTDGVSAQVLAQCWMPFGKAQQICCEQIEISASSKFWDEVGPTVLGLTVADLPVVLWCRQRSALESSHALDKSLDELFTMAAKVIVDTAGLHASHALRTIRTWRSQSRLVGDLEWTRLTPWREAISNLFDSPANLQRFASIGEIIISYTDDSLPSSAAYLAGWLMSGLNAKIEFSQVEKGFGPGVHGVELKAAGNSIKLERTSDLCVCLSIDSSQQNFCSRENTLYSLMNEELNILGPDPAFDAAAERAVAFYQ